MVGNLITCSMAAYAFARLRFPGHDLIFNFMLLSMMIPGAVTLVPTYVIIAKLEWINRAQSLIFPSIVNAFGIFMLTQFFRTLPLDLEEAARIDGASRLKTLFVIVLPLSGPALATLAVIQFMWIWNDFLWPLVTLFHESNYTLQLGLASFQGAHTQTTNLLMAGNVMSMLPVLALFIFAQRWFVRGIATQGLKG